MTSLDDSGPCGDSIVVVINNDIHENSLNGNFERVVQSEEISSTDAKAKENSPTSQFKNLVIEGENEVEDSEGKRQDNEETTKENEKRNTLRKIIQTVTRKGRSSSVEGRGGSEGGRSPFGIFRRSWSKTDLEEGTGSALGRFFGRSSSKTRPEGGEEAAGSAPERGGTLGRLFRRRSLSKNDLRPDMGEAQSPSKNSKDYEEGAGSGDLEAGKERSSTLSRIFGRKKDHLSAEVPQDKTASLGRRLSSTVRSTFSKKGVPKALENPPLYLE